MFILSRTLGWAGVRFIFWRFNALALGIENIPQAGPVLFVGNHQSNFDGVLVFRSIRRRMHTVIKSDGEHPVALVLLSILADMFPMVRSSEHGNNSDITAMRKALVILNQGRAVCIFPEAHRSPEVIGFHHGISTLARRVKGLRIVPFGIIHSNLSLGTVLKNLLVNKIQTTERPTVVFGKPFTLPETILPGKNRREDDANFIRRQVLDLLPSEMEGGNHLHRI